MEDINMEVDTEPSPIIEIPIFGYSLRTICSNDDEIKLIPMCNKLHVIICLSTAHNFILACGSCLKGLVSVSTSDNKDFPHSSLFSLFSEAVNDTSSDTQIRNIFEHLNATIQSTILQSLYKFNKLSSTIIAEKMDPV
jgi:hypothetical protein